MTDGQSTSMLKAESHLDGSAAPPELPGTEQVDERRPMLIAPPAHSTATLEPEATPTWTFEHAQSVDVTEESATAIPGESPDAEARIAVDAHVASEQLEKGESTTPTWSLEAGETTNTGIRRASFGPSGKHRSPLAVVLLSILTLGVYGLVWYSRINREMGDFDPRMHVYSGRSTWAIVVPWLVGLTATVGGAADLIATRVVHLAVAIDVPILVAFGMLGGLLVVPYLILLLPFSIVATVMTLERIRMVEEHVGMTSDVQVRPARSVGRLLVPLGGFLSLLVHAQGRLNGVWDRVDGITRRSRGSR